MSAEYIVLVKRPYTTVDPVKVTLKTDSAFDGTGTVTRAKDIIDFSLAAGGPPLQFDGTDNKFQGANLTAGVDLYAVAKTPSAAMNDVVLTLTLTGGSKKPGPPATTKLTAVQITLDVCEPRVDDKTDPTPLPTAAADPGAATPTDKYYLGRPLPEQIKPKKIDERAKLTVKDVKPAGFKGNLEIKADNDQIELYAAEKPTDSQKPLKLPLTLSPKSVGAKGYSLYVEGAKPSAAARDTGVTVGVKGVNGEADHVRISVCHTEIVSNITDADLKAKVVAQVPERPERKTSSTYVVAPIIVGLEYPIELRPYIEKGTPSAWKWSTPSNKIALTDDDKEVVKLKAEKLSGKLNDIPLEVLLTTDIGKLKKKHRMTSVQVEMESVISGDAIKHGDPINRIKNPSGCVIPSGGGEPDKNAVPRYKITKIKPNFKWTDNDERLSWWIIGGDAKGDNQYDGKADFMDSEKAKRGTKIQVYGTTEGDILIQPYSGGFGYGMFRAQVVAIKQLKYRVSRIFTKAQAVPARAAHKPTQSHDKAKLHMKIVNIYLRQVGFEMISDDSAEVAKPAGNTKVGLAALDPLVVSVTVVEPGHFDVEVNDERLTFNSKPNQRSAIRINARNEVINFAYIEQDPSAGTLATALLCPANHAPSSRARQPEVYSVAAFTLDDLGTPSSSLIPKTGIPPDTPADKVSMNVLEADVAWQAATPADRDENLLWGIIVPTRNIDGSVKAPVTANKKLMAYGNTLAHEIGHVLGLGHRGDVANPVTDSVAIPAKKNIMDPDEPPPTAENFDIIQTKAVRFSEVMSRNP